MRAGNFTQWFGGKLSNKIVVIWKAHWFSYYTSSTGKVVFTLPEKLTMYRQNSNQLKRRLPP